MAYRITITNLDTNEVENDHEVETFVVLTDEGDSVHTINRYDCGLNTAANMAEALHKECEHILGKLPEGLRKVVRKIIRKNAKQAAKKR